MDRRAPFGADASGAPTDFLAALAAASGEAGPAARRLLASLGAPGVMGRRDVWLSWAPLDRRELVLAAAAYLGGWAVFREPGEAIHPATFAWSRPTIATGDGAALAALAESLTAIAPRWGRERWLRRRLARLRAWIITGEVPSAQLAARLQALTPAARVLPLPESGW
jgi:hypothetical protein